MEAIDYLFSRQIEAIVYIETPWFLVPVLLNTIVVKNLQENLPTLNIHARAPDRCVEQRRFMTSGWRNLL